MKIIIADLECDGFHPSVIHLVGILDYITDEYTGYHGENVVDGLLTMEQADVVIVYNGKGYDIPVITRLTEGLISIDKRKVVDALDLSRKLVSMENHKLRTWGDLFDFPKGDHTDFSRYSPEMDVYCERDCRLTKLVFDLLHEMLIEQTGKSLISLPY